MLFDTVSAAVHTGGGSSAAGFFVSVLSGNLRSLLVQKRPLLAHNLPKAHNLLQARNSVQAHNRLQAHIRLQARNRLQPHSRLQAQNRLALLDYLPAHVHKRAGGSYSH